MGMKNKFLNKLKTHKEIKEIARNFKGGLKLVTINGSFDMFHAGHIYILKKANEVGDCLFVGVNSDKSIKKYKGSDRPIIFLEYRLKILNAIQYIDFITVFNESEIAIPLIKLVLPDIHINGAEYGRDCIESEICKENNIQLMLIENKYNISTSKIIKKIKNAK